MLFVTQTALELGFQYALVAMALFLSYRVLDIADLTTDGCFILGCAVSVSLTAAGHPFLAIPSRHAGRGLCRVCHRIPPDQAGSSLHPGGLVTNTGLYTVNLMGQGWRANQSLLRQDTIFTLFRDTGIGGSWNAILLSAGITVLAGVLLVLFLGTRLGLSIRATGDNRDMVRASSINPTFTITIGLCIANALTALSGAVVGQAQKTADINAGTGVVVIGLACLIIGETIVGRGAMFRGAVAVIVGSILYRFIYAIVLYTKVVPIDCLKLVTAIVVGLAIAAPTLKSWAAFQARKRKAQAARKGEK